jgi:hypothetical protein
MLDWFREIGQELVGIDSEAAKKERKEKEELKKLNKFIFSKTTKVAIIILAIIYIFMAGNMIYLLKSYKGYLLQIVKYIIMSILAIIIIFSLIFGKKKGEIVALIIGFIFIVMLFLSTVLS